MTKQSLVDNLSLLGEAWSLQEKKHTNTTHGYETDLQGPQIPAESVSPGRGYIGQGQHPKGSQM